MKKLRLAAAITIMTMAICLSACGENNPPPTSEPNPSGNINNEINDKNGNKTELALITSKSSVYDDTMNQDISKAMKDYADQNSLKFKSYEADKNETNSYLDTVKLAADNGAKLVVMNGADFENAAFHAQELYTDVNFILIDGKPNNGDETPVYRTNSNMASIMFADEQLGYLCGYAAVRDGYTKLGCIGHSETPEARNYVYGFAQGAEAAAKEMKVSDITLKCDYLKADSKENTPKDTAENWYKNGTQVIAAYGGKVCDKVIEAADANKGKVICSDGNKDENSDSVLVMASRGAGAAVTKLIGQYYAGTFPGGETVTFNAANEGIKLAMDKTGFSKFNEQSYKTLFSKLSDGTIKIKNSDAVKSESDLGLTAVKISKA